MLNSVNIVGRLVQNPELKIDENGKKYSIIVLAVPRSYKNEEGYYDTDFIDILLKNVVAINTCEYCRKGDAIGVVGRIENRFEEDKEKEESRKITYVVADRVSFISACKKESE